ncbi:MAG: ribbon-helix-helix protein, CopG family [Chloroflexi bacterium]|nr:ribbon-helix-helix protein, CopG family [Chloroflexota bacterium]
MPNTAKVAISLPEELLKSIEEHRKASGESRSQLFRRAVEEFLKRQREREDIERYVQGYLDNPETAEDMAMAESDIQPALAEIPWDDGANQ